MSSDAVMTKYVVAPSRDGVDFKTHVILKTEEGKFYKMSKEAAKLNSILNKLLEDASEDDKCEFPVEMSAAVAPFVIEYCEYHKASKGEAIPQPLMKPLEEYLGEWDKTYVKTHLVVDDVEDKHEMLLKVMSAAHYLDNEDLLNLTSAKVASMIQDKSPEAIRKLFNLPDDFTPEQRARNEAELKALGDL